MCLCGKYKGIINGTGTWGKGGIIGKRQSKKRISQVWQCKSKNLNVGNDKQILLSTVTPLLPYIGYPRTLNAIRCINEVIPE